MTLMELFVSELLFTSFFFFGLISLSVPKEATSDTTVSLWYTVRVVLCIEMEYYFL